MICSKEDGLLFLAELLSFSRANYYNLVLLNVTDYFIDLYSMAQFGVMKYGEDACFKLEEYNLKGGAVAKVRAAINHAIKAGITVYEYKPKLNYDATIELQIQGISQEWLKGKNMPEMEFMLGGIGLDEPRERRYFYAMDDKGIMLGFVVFLPYLMGKGYLADVTRRVTNAPQGVLEKIIYDAFMTMRDEGVSYGNMGLSPLYSASCDSTNTVSEKISRYIYENLNAAYDFKALHHAKEKYAPTHWESRYLVYYPKPMTFKYAYAIVKAQNPEKLSTIIVSQIKEIFRTKDNKKK
jgi:phosphatidylglycerol lysyltransferase